MKKPELEVLLKERDAIRDALSRFKSWDSRNFLSINREYSTGIGNYSEYNFTKEEVEVIIDTLKYKLEILEGKIFSLCKN